MFTKDFWTSSASKLKDIHYIALMAAFIAMMLMTLLRILMVKLFKGSLPAALFHLCIEKEAFQLLSCL